MPLRPLTAFALFAALSIAPAAWSDDSLSRVTLHALTDSQTLISFRADAPGVVLNTVELQGHMPGEQLVGIDYRVAYGVMFGLGNRGRIYTVDVASGTLTPVSEYALPLPLQGRQFGFDFNPTVDRIRIVSDTAQNLRAHPETGAMLDYRPEEVGLQQDDALHYVEGDPNHGINPRVVASAYTYNSEDETLTTNFVIDLATQALVRQGSHEGVEPVVSPNTGQLFSIGPLAIPEVTDAHFDISDINNIALAAFSTAQNAGFGLYWVTLETGAAEFLGTIGNDEVLLGIAIEP